MYPSVVHQIRLKRVYFLKHKWKKIANLPVVILFFNFYVGAGMFTD